MSSTATTDRAATESGSVATAASSGTTACIDGNEAAAKVAYALSEVIAIYPITPASAMGEQRELRVFTIDATRIARELKMPGRINTIMQPCFFALTDVMELGQAIGAIKASIETAYGRRGRLIAERNDAAVDRALVELAEVTVPDRMPPSPGPPKPLRRRGGTYECQQTARTYG